LLTKGGDFSMKEDYISTFKTMDKSKLVSRAEVLQHLSANGAHYPSLAQIINQYEEHFGIDPVWHYPLSDDRNNGAFIVPVQEGYLWLPYNEVDSE